MKRCPECGRDYNDDSLSFCLDDGSELLFGPAASMDEPATAILSEPGAVATGFPRGESSTRAQIYTTEKTAILSGGEAEPRDKWGGSSERQSLSAHRAAEPHGQGAAEPREERAGSKRYQTTKLLAALIVAAVLLIGGYFGYRYFSSGSKQIDSIAVMPFVNGSNFPDDEYLSDGMTETLIRTLSQLPNLNVKSRSSVFRYKGKETDPKTIANELGVQAIVSGRVVQRGDGLVLSIELIEAETENVLWAEQYERKSSDLVALQNEVARDVSAKLRSKLSGDDQEKLAKTYTTNPEAYRLYLQGRFFWNKRDENSFARAVEYFNQAIAIDANYALAYSGLADTYALMSTFGFVPQREGMPKAQQYARQAMALDDSLAEPHTALAVTLQSYEYDFAGAEREYRRAIELNPNYLTGHQWYGEMLVCAGRFDEAVAEYRRAIEIDPLSVPANWEYARSFYYARKVDESIELHAKLIEMDPAFQGTYRTLFEAYRVKGQFEKASDALVKFFELGGESNKAEQTRAAFAKDGWKGVLQLMTVENRPLQFRHAVVARAYLELGEKDKAFEELNRAFEKREAPLQWMKVEPQFDPLRDDPRYRDLLKRMNWSD